MPKHGKGVVECLGPGHEVDVFRLEESVAHAERRCQITPDEYDGGNFHEDVLEKKRAAVSAIVLAACWWCVSRVLCSATRKLESRTITARGLGSVEDVIDLGAQVLVSWGIGFGYDERSQAPRLGRGGRACHVRSDRVAQRFADRLALERRSRFQLTVGTSVKVADRRVHVAQCNTCVRCVQRADNPMSSDHMRTEFVA